jgi:2-iminobutanoate/2-iminopropanoate deaminase
MPNKHAVETDKAPAPVGPYSQARWCGDLLFCSGQISLDPVTGELMGNTAAGQAELLLKNVDAVLAAAGLGRGHIVKVAVFLTNMDDFASVNQVYADYFAGHAPYPARSCVAVAALPKGALVEMEMIASR